MWAKGTESSLAEAGREGTLCKQGKSGDSGMQWRWEVWEQVPQRQPRVGSSRGGGRVWGRGLLLFIIINFRIFLAW